MKILSDLKNRCGIFLFYDRDGIVDDYIIYMLKDIRKSLKHLLIVCNGEPNEEGLDKLRQESDDLIIRENTGFDVGGYREGLFYIGFKELEKYDEVVMFNYTFFGGIYPFSEMFDEMSNRDLDFWGVTKHHKVDFDPYKKNRYGYMPEHIQSHFIVLRRSLISSFDYKKFIISMKNPKSYEESICEYETILTKHFEDLGYKWEVYVNTDRYEKYAYCPIMFYAKDLLEKDRCPIIKRRSFFTGYDDFLVNTGGEPSAIAYEYICENTDYDVNMIWDNILRLENMSAVSKVMHLNYCIPDDMIYKEMDIIDMEINIWVKDSSCIQFYEDFLQTLKDKCKVNIYGKESDVNVVMNKISEDCKVSTNYTEVDSAQNLISIVKSKEDKSSQYYAFCVIDSVEKVRPYSNEISNIYKDWNCIIPSEEYIANVKQTFIDNKRMGLAIPPMPDFGEYFKMYAHRWNRKFDIVKKYLKDINIHSNIKKNESPLYPTQGNFWISQKALFSDEMERALESETTDEIFYLSLSAIVQASGMYTGTLYSNNYAEIEITNSDYMMRELNKAVFDKYGANYHSIVLNRVKNNELEKHTVTDSGWKYRTKQKLKSVLPQKAYTTGKKIYKHVRGRDEN